MMAAGSNFALKTAAKPLQIATWLWLQTDRQPKDTSCPRLELKPGGFYTAYWVTTQNLPENSSQVTFLVPVITKHFITVCFVFKLRACTRQTGKQAKHVILPVLKKAAQ